MKKHIVHVIVILFVLIFVWRIAMLLVGQKESSNQGEKPPVAVEVEQIAFEPIQDIRELTGTIYPFYRYVVSPKVSGRIIEIRKRIGDSVTTGEVIARLDDAEYQQAVIEAEANLRIAQASLAETMSQLELSKQELTRVQSLQEKGITSPSELDAAQTNYSALQSRLKLAQAQVEQREASLTSSKIRLGYTVLSATESGLIGERFVDEGSLLAPNAPVVSVIGIDKVIVRTTIIEKDYGDINVGQSAEIEVDAFPSERFTGEVARIAPMLEEASRVAQMEVEVTNDSRMLKPGMFTKVRVVLEKKESARVIPSNAVVRRSGEEGMFMVEHDTETEKDVARYHAIKIGISTLDKTEILSPEIEGLVVTLGHHLLEDGSPVILQNNSGQAVSDSDVSIEEADR